MSLHPHIGHGVGLRSEHFGHLMHETPRVDWLEVITENVMTDGGRPRAVLEKVRRDVPVVLHGVSLAIGSTDPLNETYLGRLRALADAIEPAWVSDHLCWGGFGGHYAHDLLPLPYTEDALAHVVARVVRVQETLGRRILLENVSSYVGYRASAMSEPEFVAEVVRRADCGLLLDVNNVIVSAHNHGYDPYTFIDAMPNDRVGQLHLAGHTDNGDVLLDSHAGAVPQSVWDLYAHTVRRLGPIPTLVEWDDEVPAWDILAGESAKAASIERRIVERAA